MNRFALLIATLLGVIISGAASAKTFNGDIANTTYMPQDVQCRVVIVEPGDRLWSIFRKYSSEYYPYVAPARRGNRWAMFREQVQASSPGVDLDHIRKSQILCLPLTPGMEQEIARQENEQNALRIDNRDLYRENVAIANDRDAARRDVAQLQHFSWMLMATLAVSLFGLIVHKLLRQWQSNSSIEEPAQDELTESQPPDRRIVLFSRHR